MARPRPRPPKADPAAATYGIADLAREFDVTTRTLRFYEDEGLIEPQRQGQRRIFSARDRVRLKLILRGKRLGFSIGEIREIINLYDAPPGEGGQIRFFLDKIRERRAALERQRDDIAATLAELDDVEARCNAQLREMAGKRPRT
jgi:DNA-binding transcriptional MerR regulator